MERIRIVIALAARNLLRNPGRTFSTLIAIAVGLLGLTLLDGFITYSMNGFRDAIIHSGTGHLKIASSAAYFDSGDTDPLPFMLDNEQALVSELAAMARVADVMPAMTFSAALETGGATSFVQVSAYPTAQARKDLTMRSIVKGRDLDPGTVWTILLGTGLARRLELFPAPYPVPLCSEQRRRIEHAELHSGRHLLVRHCGSGQRIRLHEPS